MKIAFQEIHMYGAKAFKCLCGRRVRRQKKFFQTINPWNQKTPKQIYCELDVEWKKWQAQSEPCVHTSVKPCAHMN